MPSTPTNPILAALVRTLLPGHPDLDRQQRATVEGAVTDYLEGQLARMSLPVGPLYRIALAAFSLSSVPLHGRTFANLEPGKQERHLRTWSDAPIAAMRDFVKLIRSTALFVYFDHPVVRQALEASSRDDA